MDDGKTQNSDQSLRRSCAVVAAVVILTYAATLAQPFDFEDDGLIVHSQAAARPNGARLAEIARRTIDDLHTEGPFRPVYWAYFEMQHGAFGGNPVGWRMARLMLAMAAAILMLVLLHELGIPTSAAFVATVLAMLAPMRSSIWYRLGLGEGLAMPFVMAALTCAVRARRSDRPTGWDVLGGTCMLTALLVKNVFIAAVPAQLLLRIWGDGALRQSWRAYWKSAAALSSVCIVPILHLLYFVQIVDEHSRYDVTRPSLDRFLQMARSIWLASGGEFLGVAFALMAAAIACSAVARTWLMQPNQQRTLGAGLLLFVSGMLVYVPAIGDVGPAGRYSIPAVWGADLFISCMVGSLTLIPSGFLRHAAVASLTAGGLLITGMNFFYQHEFIGRCRVLWQTTAMLATHAPPNANIRVSAAAMSEPERIHFCGHLAGLGRRDVTALSDSNGDSRNAVRCDIVVAALEDPVAYGWSSSLQFRHTFDSLDWLPDAVRGRRRTRGIALHARPALSAHAGRKKSI